MNNSMARTWKEFLRLQTSGVLLFLTDLKVKCLSNNDDDVLGDYSILIGETNCSNVNRDKRKELRTLCFKITILHMN